VEVVASEESPEETYCGPLKCAVGALAEKKVSSNLPSTFGFRSVGG